jgi:crotonobetainyl-CoA:carnitine CoA-transferase CaiB-like acyl-CoA transferase
LAGPLAGIRILDFTRVLAGPFATMMLGDLGAEIIKIERPGKGDDSRYSGPKANGESTHFITANRNKKSVVLDLKNPEGVRVARELAAKCDVVIENFRPGVIARLGLDYDALREVNPSLVVCSISGFGAYGPMRDRPAFDVIAQAMTGAMSVTGHPGQPPSRLGVAMGDLAGGLYAIIAILAGLRERSVTGNGTAIDIGMYDSMLGLMHYYLTDYFLTGVDPGPVGSGNPSIVPYGAVRRHRASRTVPRRAFRHQRSARCQQGGADTNPRGRAHYQDACRVVRTARRSRHSECVGTKGQRGCGGAAHRGQGHDRTGRAPDRRNREDDGPSDQVRRTRACPVEAVTDAG